MSILDGKETIGWRVTAQAPDQMTTDDAGNVVTGTLVRFITESGFRGSVFVPDIYYNAQTVHRMIEARSRVIEDVGALVRATYL